MASSNRKIGTRIIGKYLEGSISGLTQALSRCLHGETEENHKELQVSRFPY